MAGRSDAFTIEGTVRRDVLDAVHLSHRICITAKDGHTYEVEPRYLGLYLERFEGRRVVARVHRVAIDTHRNVVRLLRLKVLDRDPAEATSGTSSCRVLPHHADNGEQTFCSLELGQTET